ncbi:MAG: cobalamin-binding protein [Chloroflexi bacterium]|nr:cobalamin-binding protein [Chloroflexota bacterium]
MSNILERMQKDLYAGKVAEVEAATRQALDQGLGAQEILNKGLIGGMEVVGRDFKAGDLFIPEVLMCAKAMHSGLEVLRPLLAEAGAASMGKIVIGTVAGDLHDIGKNLVSMMLQGAGFEIIDLGADVKPERFVQAVRDESPDMIGMSAMLTTTMPSMKSTITALKEAGIRDKVKVIIGGAPVTSKFAQDIGADSYAPDAGAAVDTVRTLLA